MFGVFFLLEGAEYRKEIILEMRVFSLPHTAAPERGRPPLTVFQEFAHPTPPGFINDSGLVYHPFDISHPAVAFGSGASKRRGNILPWILI